MTIDFAILLDRRLRLHAKSSAGTISAECEIPSSRFFASTVLQHRRSQSFFR